MECNCLHCASLKLFGDGVKRRLDSQIKTNGMHSVKNKTYKQYIRGISKGLRLR